ncbi:MAG: hypothetical protein BWX99_02815 [Deltaproteobacteria bacterium ADurb.Bin151]|nr:MAG: hypothetical protein BWX99_02815 [Deltaproteobacteria bacterium ADurb.Bin151]
MRIEFRQRLAQGMVECVHRAIAFRGRQLLLSFHRNLDGGLRKAGVFQSARGDHAETFQVKRLYKLTNGFFHQNGQRSVSRVKLKSFIFHQLDLVNNFIQGIFLVQVNAQNLRFIGNIAFARHIGNQHAPAVADQFRLHVFVSQ